MTRLPPFPTDDDMLARIEYALGMLEPEPEYGLTQLLDFMSGHDDSKDVQIISGPANVLGMDVEAVLDCTEGGPDYIRDDVILALVAEVRRLRGREAGALALVDKWHLEASAARRHGNLNARMSKRHAARSLRRAIEGRQSGGEDA